ncbi:hypothetical protein ABZ819_21795 [Streptomyces venezuelae]|uniref:hypothetical protein n=1 Tax=Streptomyces venezuelae TaxID=54571 RepID=UPI00342CF33C
MSAGTVAILIASLSAVFTGANMIASWATYHRVRPRVSVKTDFRWDKRPGDAKPSMVMSLHLRNSGQNSVLLSSGGSLVIKRDDVGKTKRWGIHAFYRNKDGVEVFTHTEGMPLSYTVGFEMGPETEVAAFNGLKLEHRFSEYQVPPEHFRKFESTQKQWSAYVRWDLSDGSPVESAWGHFPGHFMGAPTKSVGDYSQLSFDDL